MMLYSGELVLAFLTTETANVTATEIITESVNQQVLLALKNYTDIGMNAPMNSPYFFSYK